ncbi:hypothetical protein ATZ36_07980 [Candidatus Endomicrobiellum trichonymphae]|uniref:Uncharacterized protein n=1 Tax=Endomicrobium trichonymphae TaxID=1408204 RepID=A0A1E5II73_ENDTX|nr:hypothetical protein ATZ36_07980 [Candidatus Endomicrobium trichonymphae]
MMDIPFDEFLNRALDFCAKVAQIQIVLIRKKEKTIPTNKLNSLQNLTIRKINKGTPEMKRNHFMFLGWD